MRHRSARPPLHASSAPRRVERPAQRPLPQRLALRLAVTSLLTGLVVGVPAAAGGSGRAAVVDSSASEPVDSPVVMGLDGVGPRTPAAAPTVAAPRTPAPAPPAPRATKAPVTPEAPAPQAAEPADPTVESQVLTLVNTQRAAAGCGALVADPALAALARAHSADMRDRHFFDHVNPDGLDPFQRAARAGLTARAENIAYGQPDPAAVMTAWMNSPGHRANILGCSLTRLGVGVAQGAGGPWWTQDFA